MVAALLSSAGPPARGQTTRGHLRDAATRQPIAGAIVTLLDSSRAILGRAITDQSGQYRIAAGTGGRMLRGVRIGYRPREVPLDRRSADSLEADILMEPLPTMLEPVRVTRSAVCPRQADEDKAFGLLQQARAGLLATVAARELLPAKMVRLNVDRISERAGDPFLHQRVYIDSGSNLRLSFAAGRSAAELVRLGFTRAADERVQYFGPDADVLLDDAFASNYCFRLVTATPNRQQQVGIGFAPDRGRPGRVDIDGVLWIDTTARELRDLEFRYFGLDRRAETIKPGGHIEFRAMPNGVVIVDRWWLHVPAVWVDTQYLDSRRVVRSGVLLREAGGEVARAEWPDGSRWRASLGEIRGQTIDETGARLARIKIGLAESDYRATSDSNGFFRIPDLVPGTYRVTAAEPDLSALGISLATAQEFSAEGDSVVNLLVRVPSSAEFVERACRSDVADRGDDGEAMSGRLLGRVVQRGGTPAAGVKIAVELAEDITGPKAVAGGGVTDRDGLFHLCRGIPVGKTVIVRAQLAAGSSVTERVQVAPGVTTVRVEVP